MITYRGDIVLLDNTLYLFDKNNLMSVEVQCYSRKDFVMPNFGITSNYGNIEIYDNDGNLLKYIKNNTLTRGCIVHVFLVNTSFTTNPNVAVEDQEKQETLVYMYIKDISYDGMTKIASISFDDRMEQMQEVNIEGIPYNKLIDGYKTPLKSIYEYLQRLSLNWGFDYFKNLDDITKKMLKETIINYKYLESGSLWQQWEKLCVASQCHIYKNNSGKTIFKYNGGN